jgi:hypothetical protein
MPQTPLSNLGLADTSYSPFDSAPRAGSRRRCGNPSPRPARTRGERSSPRDASPGHTPDSLTFQPLRPVRASHAQDAGRRPINRPSRFLRKAPFVEESGLAGQSRSGAATSCMPRSRRASLGRSRPLMLCRSSCSISANAIRSSSVRRDGGSGGKPLRTPTAQLPSAERTTREAADADVEPH